MTKNHELFKRDPKTSNLVNDGQARIVSDAESVQAIEMLRYELENFVCEGQYAAGMQRILDSFLSNLGAPSQRAAWVSGFYGSGKSHLLKMLCHLWEDTPFKDGSTARSLAPDLTADVLAALRELDTHGRKLGGGVFAVSGTMPEGSSNSARLTVLGILFRACGLPTAYNQARFCLFLKDKGYYEKLRKQIEDAGRNFERELTDLYVSSHIRKGLLECDPGLGEERDVRQILREQFPNQSDIDTSEFIRISKEVLIRKGNGKIPLTVIVLDEIQHYIGDDKDRSREVTELAEALNKQMESRVLLVAAGQNALSTDTPQFAWLRDRFTIRVELSDTDVETVTRKVLLAKKPEAVAQLDSELNRHAGEIERQLVKSSIGPNTKDRDWLVTDYPILPTRRRFWESALHAVDPTGSSSLLRTQLRITHEALRQVAEEAIGHVIPGDFMFFQQRTALVQQGALSREISDRILRLDDGSRKGRTMARVCGLVFLIRKLSRENGIDTGIRANEEMLGDLLVENLGSDGVVIRKELLDVLVELVEAGTLLFDGDEYNLQTREATEWDEKFKAELAKVRQNTATLAHERKARLRAAVESALKSIKLRQGSSQTPRRISIQFGLEAPDESGTEIPVWIRDGWEVGQNDVVSSVRAAGADSPTLFVFLPQSREKIFQDNLSRMKAAQSVLDQKGVPTTHEAEEARNAMDTRRRDAGRNIDQIIDDVLSAAKVFKGGGAELHALELLDKVKDGAEDSLSRLFPRFSEADHKAWEVAIRRARQGDDSPLAAVAWKGATEDHPVCKEILREVGSGKEGRYIRVHFEKPQFGWPRDAIDAALIALHSGGQLLATDPRTNESIQSRHLDQNRIAKAGFRTESVTLTAKDRIALKGLFQTAGLTVKPNEDLNQKAGEFLECLVGLGQDAGGSAPLPEAPSTASVDDLRNFSGNEQLSKILEKKTILLQQVGDWKKLAELTEKRQPEWERLQSLLKCGSSVSELQSVRDSTDAIEKDRLLLDGTDHCKPLIKQTADTLRAELTKAREAFAGGREKEIARLDKSEIWQKLSDEQRQNMLSKNLIPEAESSPIGTEEELISALDQVPLSHWKDRTDALPARVDTILASSARLLEPKAQRVSLPTATITDQNDLEKWVTDVRGRIEKGLKDGPVIV